MIERAPRSFEAIKMDSKSDEMSCRELLQAYALIWNSSINYMKSISLKCAIELGIPDIIHNHGQPITLSKLIESLPIQPSKARCIRRLMRLLVHSGFFTKHQEKEEEKYSITAASRLLLKDQPFKASQLFLNQFVPEFSNSCLFLSTWLQNCDKTPFETVNRRTIWDFLAQNPGQKHKYYEEMILDSKLIRKAVVEECKEVFEGVKSLVDVGGGTGTMSKAIVKRFPHIKCTVFDLPHIVAGSQRIENLNFIGGNMFEAIPPANALLLKWILHDWNDKECVTILKKCKEAIPSKEEGGKLIIIELVIEDPSKSDDKEIAETQLCFDMFMLTSGGEERNQMEWEKLFFAAGFSDYKITPIFGLRSLIEVYP